MSKSNCIEIFRTEDWIRIFVNGVPHADGHDLKISTFLSEILPLLNIDVTVTDTYIDDPEDFESSACSNYNHE